MSADSQALDLLADLISRARGAGADQADAVLVESTSLTHAQRLGRTERLERAESEDLGLRVFIGRRQAVASTTDRSKAALKELVARALAMAKAVPEDPHCGLAEADQLAREVADLDICEADEPQPEILVERASRAEDAARAVAGVTNSEGAEASWGRSRVALAASNGFAGTYATSRHALAVSVLAGEGLGMERDYAFSNAVHAADLEEPEVVGLRAGERAVKRLGPRKAETGQVPVVYDPRVARGLLRHLAGAISGTAIARGTSFLKDRLGERIFAPAVTIVDDPHRSRGLSSKPFDGEGVAGQRRNIVEAGVLTTWLLDVRSANQLGLKTTGHAARGTSSPPSPAATNLYLEPGPVSPAELMADIGQGFYVTELIGSGVQPVTGDYSRGAVGFWIEGGVPAYPVSEVTIAGNLVDMFQGLSAANDLEFRYGTDAPTVRVDGMTVAGR